MNTRIERRFGQLARERRKGFIAYVTAGDPTLEDTVDIVLRLEDAGVDVVELGVPFSDPLADGRVNQASATRALDAGATLEGVIRCVARIRERSDVPLLFFSYLNPLIARGFAKTARMSARAGVDGFLILDLPVEEDREYVNAMRRSGVNNVCLVTPTSPEDRIAKIAARSSGFVYCVSREGVTGAQKKLSDAAVSLVRRTKALTALPVAIGFGISTPEQARAAAATADAVVVGSAIVKKFAESKRVDAARWVARMVRAVKRI